MFISLFLGTFTAIYSFVYFTFVGFDFSAASSQTSIFLFLTFTQLIVILSVRNKRHLWQGSKPSLLVLGSISGFILITLAMVYIAPIAHLFSFVALPVGSLCAIIIFSIIYLFLLDYIKVYYFSLQDRTVRKVL